MLCDILCGTTFTLLLLTTNILKTAVYEKVQFDLEDENTIKVKTMLQTSVLLPQQYPSLSTTKFFLY